MASRYEIEDITNYVRIFTDESGSPSIYQPHWPDGSKWESFDEAKEWAESYIYCLEEGGPIPSQGPTLKNVVIKTQEEVEAYVKSIEDARKKEYNDRLTMLQSEQNNTED